MRLALWLVVVAGLIGCTSTREINEVMLPLAVVRKLVMENLPGGVKQESANGREITSDYFNAKNVDEPGEDFRERAYTVVTIIGSRRPYQLTVSAHLEKRIKGSKKFDKLGTDRAVSKQVVKRLKEALANRPADINVIDEFRAF